MDIDRLEAELSEAEERAAQLRIDAEEAERWVNDLRTSLAVLRKLAGEPEKPRRITAFTLDSAAYPTRVPGPSVAKMPPRGAMIAEKAAEILSREQRRIRPIDLAEMLNIEGSFDLGRGRPGAATTDLGNQLARYGNGRFVASRSYGWGLSEWGDTVAGPLRHMEQPENTSIPPPPTPPNRSEEPPPEYDVDLERDALNERRAEEEYERRAEEEEEARRKHGE
ncbi:hypothetical protein [Roseococcus sp. SYP-B2431]|uniref:hypothetical protein n=1 Tax=Roseococcus sp. SYP-B2431 TaxID=2496640 RepID=UPI0013F3F78E|nr:hypothetical protein [Roseococcus sp. SYP-B2431]